MTRDSHFTLIILLWTALCGYGGNRQRFRQKPMSTLSNMCIVREDSENQ